MRIDNAKLAYELRRRKINQNMLSEKSGVSRITISNILCGKSCASVTAEKIARTLDIPVEKLVETEHNHEQN